MPSHHVDEGTNQVLFYGKMIRLRVCERGKEPGEVPGQEWITHNRAYDFDLARKVFFHLVDHDLRAEVKHLPCTCVAIQGSAIVHLSRVHHDHIAGKGFDLSNATP
jgi:hypothetical protein